VISEIADKEHLSARCARASGGRVKINVSPTRALRRRLNNFARPKKRDGLCVWVPPLFLQRFGHFFASTQPSLLAAATARAEK